MDLSLFLNSLLEFSLSFGSEYLCDNLSIISILVLSFFVYFFIYSVGIPSTHRANFRKHEHTQKRHCRAKRRRKGGTWGGSRYYYHSKVDEEKELISFLKSPLGQNYDITRFRQLLCPDTSCKVCNNAAADINEMVFSKTLEKSTPAAAPVASPAPKTPPVTEPSFIQSTAISTGPAGDLKTTPLPEPSPPSPSVLPCHSMTPLGDSLSPSPPGQALPPEPEHHSSPRHKDLFSSTLTQSDLHQGFLALNSSKTFFGTDTAATFRDSKHLLSLSPDEQDSAQKCLNPKTLDNNLKQKLTFWGLPSLHSESLSSAVHASGDCSIFFKCISNTTTGQKSPGLPSFLPPSLPEVQPQPLPQTLPQTQDLHLTQTQPQAHLQSPLPILPSSLTSSEIEHQECNVLQKEQGNLCGLTSVVQSSKAHVAISINPVEFPLSKELREKFESHLTVRLTKHHKGQPWKTQGSLSGMRPPNNCSAIPESKSSYGLSCIPVDKDQSNSGLSCVPVDGSSYESSSERFQLESEGKDEVQNQENDPKVNLLSDSKTSSVKDVATGSDVMILSKENSMFSEQSVTQRVENVWKIHLKKTSEKIREGQLPGTVYSSQPSNKQNPIKPHTKLEQRSLPSSVGGLYRLDTSQELPSLECAAQQMQKPHIPKVHMGISSLSTKVLDSKVQFKSKDTPSYSSSTNPNFSSSSKLISKGNTKSGAFMPLRGSSEPLLRDKVRPESSADDLSFPLPATSGSKEGHSPADIQRILSEEIQKILKTKLSVTKTISDRQSQSHSLITDIQPPKMPARRAGTGPETNNNSVNSNDRADIRQADREKSEPGFISRVSMEIARDEGLRALQPETSCVMTTSKPGVPQIINRETSVTIKNPTSNLLAQAPDLSDLRTQVIAELKVKLEKRYIQAQGQPRGMSPDSDNASLTPADDDSNADAGSSEELHVNSKDSAVSVEQEPWLYKHALRTCQDQNFLPDVQKGSVCPPPKPTGSKSAERGGGDTLGRLSQTEGKRFPSQDKALEDKLWRKSPQIVLQKGQVPPPLPNSSLVDNADSHFLDKMKNFFQWLQPGTQSGKPVQKGAVQAQAEPGQGKPFHGTNQVTNATSSRHTAILPGQGSTYNRNTRNEDKHPHNVMALKPEQMHQKDPQSVSLKGTVPHRSPTCRPQAAMGRPAVPATSGGTEHRDPPPRFRHTMLLQNFQRDTFASPR